MVKQLVASLSSDVKIHLIVSGYLKKSQTMSLYEKIFASTKVKHLYLPAEIARINGLPNVDEFKKLLCFFRNNNSLITLVISDPYKIVSTSFVDVLTDNASKIGAVNLIYKKNGLLIGENIDGEAFVMGLKKEVENSERFKSMFFFGCGGVSSAVAVTMSSRLESIGLISMHRQSSETLYNRIKDCNKKVHLRIYSRDTNIDLREYDVIYNGTGLGKYSNDPSSIEKTPLDMRDYLRKNSLAIDANYTPWETRFLHECRLQALSTLNGYSHMLAFVTLHLNTTLGLALSYEDVKNIADNLRKQQLQINSSSYA
jgi:shikimate dehydrogenase